MAGLFLHTQALTAALFWQRDLEALGRHSAPRLPVIHARRSAYLRALRRSSRMYFAANR